MTKFDYMCMYKEEKEQWLNSLQIISGLRYFGGKARIAKYLINHILNMAVKMEQDKHYKIMFVDAFAGGGKIALSMPEGWFDTIVLNDINYGVYSFFDYCKNEPEALIRMIEELGSIMSEQFFKFCAKYRSDKRKVQPLVSAAMTYWVTQTSFNGVTDSEDAEYRYSPDKDFTRSKERVELERISRRAREHVMDVHNRMLNMNIIIENLDYKELIKACNGKPYIRNGVEQKPLNGVEQYSKLWYFDPPYHPATLHGGQAALYEDTFEHQDVKDMVAILHGDYANIYGELEYFIKSDYSPRTILRQVEEQLEEIKMAKVKKDEQKQKDDIIKKYQDRIKIVKPYEEDFDILEENVNWINHKANDENPEFYRVLVGEFDKGSLDNENRTTVKGTEYIWCRGNYIKGMVSD